MVKVMSFDMHTTDIDDYRLAFAKEQGADDVINVKGQTEAEVASVAAEKFGERPDVTMECSGSDFSMRLGIHVSVYLFIVYIIIEMLHFIDNTRNLCNSTSIYKLSFCI